VKQILLCTDGSLFSQSSYKYGAWLANRLQAKVDVIYVTDTRRTTVAETRNLSGSVGFGAAEALLNQLVALEHERAKLDRQRAQIILEDARQVLSDNGVKQIELIHETGFLVDCLESFEKEADLIILGKRGETAEFASKHLGANIERIVRASSKPCLVTSRQFKPVQRLLLAYDGSPSGQKMLQFLIDSPALKGLELYIITVGKNLEDETAIATIKEAQQKSQIGGFQPISILKEGSPEIAIATCAEENKIDLLMMGAYGHNRIRYLVIGSTTTQILRTTKIPVLLFR